MTKYAKRVLIICFCSAICLSGGILSYLFMKTKQISATKQEAKKEVMANVNLNAYDAPETEEETIKPHTLMVYEYFYTTDGQTETTEEVAPSFMLNLNYEKLKNTFSDWQIISFTTDKVVMRKNINSESTHHYVLGVQDGFITIFYQKPINGTNIKEITQIPLSSLPTEEQEKLEQGVLIDSNDELFKALEDYTS